MMGPAFFAGAAAASARRAIPIQRFPMRDFNFYIEAVFGIIISIKMAVMLPWDRHGAGPARRAELGSGNGSQFPADLA